MFDMIRQAAQGAQSPTLFIYGIATVDLTGLVLLASVAFKFFEHARRPQELAERQDHAFSTREMLIGVLALFPFWVNSIGQIRLEPDLEYLCFSLGAILMLAALSWHLRAKRDLRLMWSDGIEIKREHRLITSGAYALARHPMYASLLLWCWGASLAMFNAVTLLLISFFLLPLMILRARDEERKLVQVNPDYLLYQKNVRQLTPTLSGKPALSIRIAALLLFGFYVAEGLSLPALLLFAALHLYLGYSLKPEKVAFSYRSKAGLMIVFWGLSQLWAPAYNFLYLILAMLLYGLKFDCPCMLLYEKYGRCPCFALIRKCR